MIWHHNSELNLTAAILPDIFDKCVMFKVIRQLQLLVKIYNQNNFMESMEYVCKCTK